MPGDIWPPEDDMWSPEDEGFLAPDDDEEPPDSYPPEDDECIAPEDMPPPVEPFPEGVWAVASEIQAADRPSIVMVASVKLPKYIFISEYVQSSSLRRSI
jgi:hypothetical protein